MYTVMIADDEKAIRSNLPHALDFRRCGFQVAAVARNGRDALEQLERQPVDLLLLDISMPVLDGLGVLRELAAWPEERRPLVILLSGYSNFEYARAAIRYGAKGYLLKPVDEEEAEQLLGAVRKELDTRVRRLAGAGASGRVSLLRELFHGGGSAGDTFRQDMLLHVIDLNGGAARLRGALEETIPGGAE